jgi:hypothetical protein
VIIQYGRAILIEDGRDKLVVNQKILNILWSLVSRGIVVSLCSKNNTDSEKEILDI